MKMKLFALIAGLWITLGVVTTVNSQPAAPMPATMSPAPAAMPAARPAATRPAAMVATPRATAPAPAMTPTMAATEAMTVTKQPTMAAAPSTPKAKKEDSKGSVVGGWALQILLYLLSVAVTAIVPVLTGWAWNKWKLDKYAQKDMVDGMVLKAAKFGIGKANEQAYKLRDNPMKSAEKLDVAIKSANKYLVDSGLPEKGAEYLADLIESELGHKRDSASKVPVEAKKEAEEPKKEEKPKAEEKDEKKEE